MASPIHPQTDPEPIDLVATNTLLRALLDEVRELRADLSRTSAAHRREVRR